MADLKYVTCLKDVAYVREESSNRIVRTNTIMNDCMYTRHSVYTDSIYKAYLRFGVRFNDVVTVISYMSLAVFGQQNKKKIINENNKQPYSIFHFIFFNLIRYIWQLVYNLCALINFNGCWIIILNTNKMNKVHKIRDDITQMVSKMRGISVHILTFLNVRVGKIKKKKEKKDRDSHSACTFIFECIPLSFNRTNVEL